MMTGVKRLVVFVCGAGFFSIITPAIAQPYIYPNQGQTHSRSSSTRASAIAGPFSRLALIPQIPR